MRSEPAFQGSGGLIPTAKPFPSSLPDLGR